MEKDYKYVNIMRYGILRVINVIVCYKGENLDVFLFVLVNYLYFIIYF